MARRRACKYHVSWKCHVLSRENATSSRGNAMSRLVEMPRLVSWKYHVSSRGNATSRGNPTSRLVEISISTGKIGTLHAKYRVLPRVSTRVKMKL